MSLYPSEERKESGRSKNSQTLRTLPSQPPHQSKQPPKHKKCSPHPQPSGRNAEQASMISPLHSQLQPPSLSPPLMLPSFTTKYLQSSNNALSSSQNMGSGRDLVSNLPALSKNQHTKKARMVREINLRIQLLEAKAKQPGAGSEDLMPLRDEIYNHFDQYEIGNFAIPKAGTNTNTANAQSNVPPFQNFATNRQKFNAADDSLDCIASRTSLMSGREESRGEIARPISSLKVLCIGTAGDVLSQVDEGASMASRRIIETRLGEEQFAILDRSPPPRHSQYGEDDPRILELQESSRVMEERIGFLIQRLEEGRKEVRLHKEEKERVYLELEALQKENLVTSDKLESLQPAAQESKQICKSLEEALAELRQEKSQLQKSLAEYQQQLPALTEELSFIQQKLKQKQEALQITAQMLGLKETQCRETARNLSNLERQFTAKRDEMLQELYQSQNSIINLKKAVRNLTRKLEQQGVNMHMAEVEKLKNIMEEHVVSHQKELANIDQSYSQQMAKIMEDNRKLKVDIKKLQQVITAWVMPYPGQCKCPPVSDDIPIEEVPTRLCGFTAQRLSKAFLEGVSRMEAAKHTAKECQHESLMFRERLLTIRDKYEDKVNVKTEEAQKLSQKNSELIKFNRVVREEKQELLNQVIELRRKEKEINMAVSRGVKLTIAKAIVEWHYPESGTQYLPRGGRMSLEIAFKSASRLSLDLKVSMVIALLEHSHKMSHYGRYQKKLPPLLPSRVTFKRTDNGIEVDLSKAEDSSDQVMLFRAPQTLLGFSETPSSHCWTVGIVLDCLLHGREFYKKCDQILTRTDNYYIRSDQFRRVDVLHRMLRKNPRQRATVTEAKMLLEEYLAFIKL